MANEPPPQYGSDLAPAREPVPPASTTAFSGTLHRAATIMEEWLLSTEVVSERTRVGTLARRGNNNSNNNAYEQLPDDSSTTNRTRRGQLTGTLARLRRGHRQLSRREVMDSLPTFWPVCTIFFTVVQIGMFVGVCIAFGIAPISFNPKTETSDCIPGFGTSQCEYESREVAPNFFIGPSSTALVHVGALYTPCMRENVEFQVEAAQARDEEQSLRCCYVGCSRDECGMVPLDDCLFMECADRDVLGGASICRNESVDPTRCSGNVTLHPCCIGLLGDCVITSEENCSFNEGTYHPDLAVCSDVPDYCFQDVCTFTWSPWLDDAQLLRFVFAIFLHRGVVDLLVVVLAQLYICWRIEKRIGWLRVSLIYIMSGVGGFLISGIMDATAVSVGATGSLFGLMGVLLVELFQGWKWVQRPWLELIKLLSIDVFFLAMGTLPYIDNFANIGGFIFGILWSFVVVPYISLGKWDRAKKLCLILLALPTIAFLFLAGFVIFFNISDPNFCPECSYINCIPYTETFCENFLGSLSGVAPTITVPPPESPANYVMDGQL